MVPNTEANPLILKVERLKNFRPRNVLLPKERIWWVIIGLDAWVEIAKAIIRVNLLRSLHFDVCEVVEGMSPISYELDSQFD